MRHAHLYASKIANLTAYILTFKLISSIDSELAYFIAAAVVIKYIADELYVYELYKEEKDLIEEFDRVLKMKKDE